jgi:hypothetical protein
MIWKLLDARSGLYIEWSPKLLQSCVVITPAYQGGHCCGEGSLSLQASHGSKWMQLFKCIMDHMYQKEIAVFARV